MQRKRCAPPGFPRGCERVFRERKNSRRAPRAGYFLRVPLNVFFFCRSGGMADAADLKSAVFGRAGSSPAFGTSAGRGTGSGNRSVQAGSRSGRAEKKRAARRAGTRARFRRRGFPAPVAGTKKNVPEGFPRGNVFSGSFRASSHLRRRREATSASAPRPASRPNADGSGTAGSETVTL